MVARQEGLLASRHGLGVTLHDVQSVVEELRVRLRLESGGVVDVRRQVGLLAGGWRPDVGVRSVEGGGVGHAVGRGHGASASPVVHTLRHVVASLVVARAIAVLLRKVQVSPHIGLGLRPLLVVEADLGPGLGTSQARPRGGDLVETVLENLVQVHRVLSSGDGVHLVTSARVAGQSLTLNVQLKI